MFKRRRGGLRRLLVRAVAGALAVSTPAVAIAKVCAPQTIAAQLAENEPGAAIDRQAFFDLVKASFPPIGRSEAAVAGTSALLDAWEADPRLSDRRWLAYILATAYRETGQSMRPVRQTMARTDAEAAERMSRKPWAGRFDYWKPDAVTGERYFGRGYVQLTWDYNYKMIDARFGLSDRADSVYWNPSRLLEPELSARVAVEGMVGGWFTGRCLARYFPAKGPADWLGARRIINGTDRADLFAADAQLFLAALEAAQQGPTL